MQRQIKFIDYRLKHGKLCSI